MKALSILSLLVALIMAVAAVRVQQQSAFYKNQLTNTEMWADTLYNENLILRDSIYKLNHQ